MLFLNLFLLSALLLLIVGVELNRESVENCLNFGKTFIFFFFFFDIYFFYVFQRYFFLFCYIVMNVKTIKINKLIGIINDKLI